jgi:hypothetical protein
VATATEDVHVSDPELGGFYEVAERRADGSLLLRPGRARLSAVLQEPEGAVFHDEEFIAHVQQVATADEDLSSDRRH